jgi:hypothetical protein
MHGRRINQSKAVAFGTRIATGAQVVSSVLMKHEAFNAGPYLRLGPDLVVGYASNQSCTETVPDFPIVFVGKNKMGGSFPCVRKVCGYFQFAIRLAPRLVYLLDDRICAVLSDGKPVVECRGVVVILAPEFGRIQNGRIDL